MSELDEYRQRMEAACEALDAVPIMEATVQGPPDERTGERWDRTNVLGHMAEMLPFWTAQVRELLGGAPEFGRGEMGNERRRQGIDSGPGVGEEELRQQIREGIDGLFGLLAELHAEDLDRKALYRTSTEAREVQVRYVLDELLVGHLEAHVRQLQELSVGG